VACCFHLPQFNLPCVLFGSFPKRPHSCGQKHLLHGLLVKQRGKTLNRRSVIYSLFRTKKNTTTSTCDFSHFPAPHSTQIRRSNQAKSGQGQEPRSKMTCLAFASSCFYYSLAALAAAVRAGSRSSL
jgi:hypothetical protein